MDQVQSEVNTLESESYRYRANVIRAGQKLTAFLRDPSYKFATGCGTEGHTEKRMYKREAAIEEYKRIRALFTDLKGLGHYLFLAFLFSYPRWIQY